MAQDKGTAGRKDDRTEAKTETGAAQDATEAHYGSATRAPYAQTGMRTGQSDVDQLQAAAAEVAPQLGTAAVAAIATAIISAEFLPAVLVGAGAAMLPKLLPGVGYLLRPVLRTVIRVGYTAYNTAQQVVAEAGEQVQDVIAEVQAEQGGTRPDLRHRETTATTGTGRTAA